MENKKVWTTPELEKLSVSGVTEGGGIGGSPDGDGYDDSGGFDPP